MRTIWVGAAVMACFCLAACEPPAPADPLAGAERACADGRADAASRMAACGGLVDAADAPGEVRAAALAQRGELHRMAGDPTAALRDFASALALQPDNTDAKLGRAAVLLASGQLDAAALLIDGVLASVEPPARAHTLRGDLNARFGDRAGAIAEYDAALAQAPREAEARAGRGLVKQANGDFDGARVDLDAAIDIAPNNAAARAGRCWNRLQRQGDIADARRDAEAAIAADPALTTGRLCYGLVLLRQEQWADAHAAYDAALALEPANATALFGRGFARREAGERREGDADIRRAYEYNSEVDEEFERFGVDF